MNDVTDLRIRRALAEIVDTAPMVRPLEQFLPFTRAVAGASRRTHRSPVSSPPPCWRPSSSGHATTGRRPS